MLHVHLVRNAEKIPGSIAPKLFFNLAQTAGDTVDGLVGEIFGFDAGASGEDFYQAPANILILDSGLFAI
jgi:hypothetical protein